MTAETSKNHPGSKRPAGKVAKASHTPGPWSVAPKHGKTHIDGVQRERFNAIVAGPKESRFDFFAAYVSGIDRATMDANAQLIASAPDLLLACEAIMLSEFAPGEKYQEQLDLAVRLAKAAINKTKGQ